MAVPCVVVQGCHFQFWESHLLIVFYLRWMASCVRPTWFDFFCFSSTNAETLHSANKGNSLARSNASLYGNKEELYDRLRRHAYQGGKKGIFNHHAPIKSIIAFIVYSPLLTVALLFSPFSTSREEWQRNHQRKWRTLKPTATTLLFVIPAIYEKQCQLLSLQYFVLSSPKRNYN